MIIFNIMFKGLIVEKFYFWVKPKLQMYNTSSKKKLYAYKIEYFDDNAESKRILKYMKNLLDIH